MKALRRVGSFVAACAVCAMVVGFQGTGFCTEVSKDMVAELQKIKSEGQPFQVKMIVGEKKDAYKAGETVSLFFTADRDCYVYILDIGTSGKVHMLFPNKWETVNKAEKGKVYKIPTNGRVLFKVKAPEGTNYLKAIATLKPMQALSSVDRKDDGPFAELTEPMEKIKDVGLELAAEKDWTEAEISFKVVK